MKFSIIKGERKDHVLLAIGVIVITDLALSLGDALIKLTSDNFVIWQIFVLRSVISVPFLIIYMATFTPGSFRISDGFGWTILRSLLLVAMWVSYYLSLAYIPLSIAAAAYYTLPIFITLFSAVFIGDRIGGVGWTATTLGFLGVLLVIKPNAVDFDVYVLLPLLSAVLYALAMILTRTKCQSSHPLLLALSLNLSFIIVGCIVSFGIALLPNEFRQGFLLAPWEAMDASRWYSMGLLAIAILIGSIGAAFAYQNAPPSIIGVFDFSYVGFAVLWGLVFFSELPDILSLFGIALIVVAGMVSVRR